MREILNELAAKENGEQRVWAITDEDADESKEDGAQIPNQVLKWDRYHIENYLLEEKYIAEALRSLELEMEPEKDIEALVRTELKNT